MSEQMSARLAELRTEFESGQARLKQLEVEQSYLRDRLLMVKGAIDVLEDLIGAAPVTSGNGRAPGAQGTSHQEVP